MISVQVRYDGFAGVVQTGSLYIRDSATLVDGPETSTELSGNSGNYLTAAFSINELVQTPGTILDFVAKDEDGNGLIRGVIIVPASSSTVRLTDASTVLIREDIEDVQEAVDGIDIPSPEVVTVLSPLYLLASNAPGSLDISLLVGEIKDIAINMFQSNGAPFTEDDNPHDTITVEVRTMAHKVVEASLTASLSGNVLTFRSTTAMVASDRPLKIIVWGNGPSSIKTNLGSGICNVMKP